MRHNIIPMVFALILLFLPLANALLPADSENIQITREVQGEAKVGNLLTIKIVITNNQPSLLSLKVEERIAENFELINPNEPTITKTYNGINVSFLNWDVQLKPNEAVQLIYTINPKQAGDITLSPTKVTETSADKVFQGRATKIEIKCNMNGVCETGENFLNCVEDCPTGSKDGVCDYATDGICDPDCTDDPDCTLLDKIDFTSIITIVVIILAIFMVIRIIKKKKQQFK